jgi:hypothetical protein
MLLESLAATALHAKLIYLCTNSAMAANKKVNSTGLIDYLSRKLNSDKVTQRLSTGYMSGSDMCKDWSLRLIAGDLSLVYDLIMRYESQNRGMRVLVTMTTADADVSHEVHVRMHLIHTTTQQYAHPMYRINHDIDDTETDDSNEWNSRFMSGDLSLVYELVMRYESQNAGMRVMASITTATAGIDRDEHAYLHVLNTVIKRVAPTVECTACTDQIGEGGPGHGQQQTPL